MVTPESLLLFLVFQLVLYGLPLGLLIYAIRNYRAKPGQARVLIAIAIAPFAYYAYCLFAGQIAQPLLRDREVASWPRKTITRDNLPKLLIADAWWVGKSLVGVGPFEKAYGQGPEGWYVFERSSNPDCPSRDEWQEYPGSRDLLKPTRCVLAAKSREPDTREAHLRLFFEDTAPSRHRPGGTVVSSSTLELRWVAGTASELVAFWEIPYFDTPTFPPLLVMGWARNSLHAPRRYEQRPEPRTFVLDSIGMKR